MALPFKKKPQNTVDDVNVVQKEKKPLKLTKKVISNDFIRMTREFETTRIDEIEKSRNVAWKVALGSCVVSICLAVAIVFLTPLKEIRPYLVRVDNTTGQTDIVNTLTNAQSDYGEETAKFFAANYVRLVEGYDWYTVQSNFDKAMLFASNEEQNRLKNKFTMPDAPHKLYQNKQRVNIDVNSVSKIGENLLQVRFTKRVEPTDGGIYNANENSMIPAPTVSQHIATIGYDYINLPTSDDARLINPLGFVVKTYRVDTVMGEKQDKNAVTTSNVVTNVATNPVNSVPTVPPAVKAPAVDPNALPAPLPVAPATQTTTTTANQ